MDEDLAQEAIAEALKGSWEKAITLNLEILKSTPNDVDALNRLARAYAENGNIKKAKLFSKKALLVDPFNKIAQKCMIKWNNFKNNICNSSSTISSTFIEEPGKTKIISLYNLASNTLLAGLDSGDEVVINPQGHSVSILTPDGKYIGRLPDNVGTRIKNLIKGGNDYKSIIKSIAPDSVKIFIREIKCSAKQSGIPSFLSDKTEFTTDFY